MFLTGFSDLHATADDIFAEGDLVALRWTIAGTHDGEFQTVGGAANTNSVIVSSEPLTRDTSTWVEVPEYSMLTVVPKDDGQHEIRILSIDD